MPWVQYATAGISSAAAPEFSKVIALSNKAAACGADQNPSEDARATHRICVRGPQAGGSNFVRLSPYVFMFALLMPQDSPAVGSEVASLLTDASAKWKEQRSGWVSGRASVRIYRFADLGGSQVTRKQVEQILDTVSRDPRRETLSHMLDGLQTGQWGDYFKRNRRSSLWDGKLDVVLDGTKVKNILEETDHIPTLIFDGENTILDIPTNNQIDINHQTTFERFDKEALRFIPRMDYGAIADKFTLVSKVSNIVHVRSDHTELVFDIDTAFIRKLRTWNDAGDTTFEVRQYAPFVEGGDLVFPKLIATVFCGKAELVTTMTALLIEHIAVNDVIDPDEFKFAAKPGAHIFDYRRNDKSPAFSSANEVVDPVQRMDDLAAGKLRTPTRRWNSRLLISLNMLLIAGLSIFYGLKKLWHRHRSD